MSAASLLESATFASPAQREGRALQRSFEDHLIARSHVPWNLAIELSAQATGIPCGHALIGSGAAPVAGTLAHKLGHSSIRQFVTEPVERNGLGLEWSDFTREVTALVYMRRYALKSNSAGAILRQVDIVSRSLNRPPEDAAEFHKVMGSRLRHERSVEKSLRERAEAGLAKQRKSLVAQSKKAEADKKALTEKLAKTRSELESELRSLKTSLQRSSEVHRAEVDANNGRLMALSDESSAATSALKAAQEEIATLMGFLDEALEGGKDAYLSLQHRLAKIRRQGLEFKRRYEISVSENVRLQRLCDRRGESVVMATKMIRSLKAQGLNYRRRSLYVKWTLGVLTLGALIVAGAFGLIALAL